MPPLLGSIVMMGICRRRLINFPRAARWSYDDKEEIFSVDQLIEEIRP